MTEAIALFPAASEASALILYVAFGFPGTDQETLYGANVSV